VDVIFVLDASGSIESSNYEKTKSFVAQLVDRFDVETGNARIGLLTYSTAVEAGFAISFIGLGNNWLLPLILRIPDSLSTTKYEG